MVLHFWLSSKGEFGSDFDFDLDMQALTKPRTPHRMNAAWTGPLLRDVLIDSGLNVKSNLKDYDGLHVQMECNATKVQDDEWYGSSVPLGVVMDAEREVVLALEVSVFLFLHDVCVLEKEHDPMAWGVGLMMLLTKR